MDSKEGDTPVVDGGEKESHLDTGALSAQSESFWLTAGVAELRAERDRLLVERDRLAAALREAVDLAEAGAQDWRVRDAVLDARGALNRS